MGIQDYEKGLSGSGHSYNNDFQQGVRDAAAAREARHTSYVPPAPPPHMPVSSPTGQNWSNAASAPTAVSPATPAAPATLVSMAKGGATLFAVVFAGYLVLFAANWTWPQLIGGTLGIAILGAIGGAALYIAIKVLVFAVKVAAGLLLLGIALHLLGVIDLWTTLSRISHAIGL